MYTQCPNSANITQRTRSRLGDSGEDYTKRMLMSRRIDSDAVAAVIIEVTNTNCYELNTLHYRKTASACCSLALRWALSVTPLTESKLVKQPFLRYVVINPVEGSEKHPGARWDYLRNYVQKRKTICGYRRWLRADIVPMLIKNQNGSKKTNRVHERQTSCPIAKLKLTLNTVQKGRILTLLTWEWNELARRSVEKQKKRNHQWSSLQSLCTYGFIYFEINCHS